MSCVCKDSDFIDKNYQHIVTCNLKNNKLRTMSTKSDKYRENISISWERDNPSIMESLSDCIDTCCNKHGIDKSIFTEWKYKVKSKADEKINK